MNIEINHINNTLNYGSMMMAITLIYRLNKSLDGIKIYVDCKSDKDLQRLKIETESDNIYVDKQATTDILIVLGGDDISEYYGIEYLESELNRLKNLSNQKKVILLGQTMGPFTGERVELSRVCLKKTKIYTRDEKCFSYLKGLNYENIFKGRDLAFLDLPTQLKAKNILSKYDLNSNEYVTIVPSGLLYKYTQNYSDYINEYVSIIKNILNNKNLEGKKVVMLPHVAYLGDDRPIIQAIMNNLNDEKISRVIPIYDEMFPSQAREVLGNGLFTVTGRMHAAVSTFYMRKPAISLSYSVKYQGVIGEGLDMSSLIIEANSDDLWSQKQISNMVNEKIEYVLNDYNNLIEKIDENVLKTTNIVNQQLDDLIKDIKN